MEYTEADRKRDEQVQNSFEVLGGFDWNNHLGSYDNDPDGKKKCGGQQIAEEAHAKSENAKANFEKSGAEFQKGHLFGSLFNLGKGLLSTIDLILYQSQLLPEVGMIETGASKLATAGALKELEKMEGHVIERMGQRGVTKEAMIDALKSPLKITDVIHDIDGYPSYKAIGRDATVVVNPNTNKIITTWPTGTNKVNKLLGK
jgi:hypothetical protein